MNIHAVRALCRVICNGLISTFVPDPVTVDSLSLLLFVAVVAVVVVVVVGDVVTMCVYDSMRCGRWIWCGPLIATAAAAAAAAQPANFTFSGQSGENLWIIKSHLDFVWHRFSILILRASIYMGVVVALKMILILIFIGSVCDTSEIVAIFSSANTFSWPRALE